VALASRKGRPEVAVIRAVFSTRSFGLSERLVSCRALGHEEWPSPSDHFPIVATFEA
jgi:hypothetical protein